MKAGGGWGGVGYIRHAIGKMGCVRCSSISAICLGSVILMCSET